MEQKYCKLCDSTKKVAEFYVTKTGPHAGRIATYCKACCSKRAFAYYNDKREQRKEIQRNWYYDQVKKDPLHSVKMKMRKWEIKLGLPSGWYERMFAEQNGVCAICGKPEGKNGTRKYFNADRRRLAIDHCHTRNIPRGLLCMSCNTKLAVLENAEFVAQARAYLTQYQP
jgi:hypothetical protein